MKQKPTPKHRPSDRFDSETFRRHYLATLENGEEADDSASEGSNLGRIFVFLLLLHVFVIGAIILFNLFSGDSKATKPAVTPTEPASAPVVAPKITYNPEDVEEYRISSGQNLDSVLDETGATREQIFALNGITRPEDFVLQVGKKILVPKKKVPKAQPIAVDQAQQIITNGKPHLAANELMDPTPAPLVDAAPVKELPAQPKSEPVKEPELKKVEEVPVAKRVPEPAPAKKTEPEAPVKKTAEVASTKPVQTQNKVQEKPVAKPSTPAKPLEKPSDKASDKTKLVDKAPAAKPVSTPTNVKVSSVHEVKSKETFYSISRKYGVRVNKLMELNGYKDPGKLAVGAKLKIPAKD